jgi:hypothetical protein
VAKPKELRESDSQHLDIKVGKLSEMTVTSAAPGVRHPPEVDREDTKSLRRVHGEVKKSNFANLLHNTNLASEESVSEVSESFDYSKSVLEDKALLKNQDDSMNPDSAKLFERTDSVIHPRVRRIELEERFTEKVKKKLEKSNLFFMI